MTEIVKDTNPPARLTLVADDGRLVLTDPVGSVQTAVIPVYRENGEGSEPIGAYVITPTGVRYRPIVDQRRLTVVAVTAVAATAAVALAAIAARRTQVGPVTMGPGGWLSVRNARTSPPRCSSARRSGRRPPWARAVRARRLVVER
jgi:hypothetical protein